MKKIVEILIILCFFAVIITVPFAVFTGEKADRLFYENRSASVLPSPDIDNILNGSFLTELEKGFSDNFPLRDEILAAHTYIDRHILKKPVVNDVVWQNEETPLLPRLNEAFANDSEIASRSERMAARMSRISSLTRENGGEFYFVGIPEQYSYFRDKYPTYVFNNSDYLNKQEKVLFGTLTEKGVKYINMYEEYNNKGHSDEFYSFIDHHYTLMGAFEAYSAIINRFNSDTGNNLKVLTKNDVSFKEVPNSYYGSRNRKLMGVYKSKEHLYVPEFKNRVPFLRTDNGITMKSVIYNYYTDESLPVTFETYMGGDIGETVIQTHREDLPNILMFGDSFTNPLEMLLYTNFNESRFLDFRYYDDKTLSSYIKDFKPDIVVMVRDDTRYLDFTGNGKLL